MERPRKSGAVSKALVVRPPWIEKILRRQKTWELRSRGTKARGPIGLIKSRSGMVVGICDVVDVVGPLSLAALRRTVRYHKVPPTQLSKPRPYKKTYAWVLRHARRLNPPTSHVHRSGAVIWVRLQSSVSRKIAQRTVLEGCWRGREARAVEDHVEKLAVRHSSEPRDDCAAVAKGCGRAA